MKLSQAVNYHSNILLDGLNSDGTWALGISKGNFLTFDRFIADRASIQKKRMYQSASEQTIPGAHKVVRLSDGSLYLVSAVNYDIDGTGKYANLYLLQEAQALVEVITIILTPAASGMGGAKNETASEPIHADLDRISSASSRGFEAVTYTKFVVTLPAGTPVNTDNEIRIGSTYYDVEEVWNELNTRKVRAVKRSSDV